MAVRSHFKGQDHSITIWREENLDNKVLQTEGFGCRLTIDAMRKDREPVKRGLTKILEQL